MPVYNCSQSDCLIQVVDTNSHTDKPCRSRSVWRIYNVCRSRAKMNLLTHQICRTLMAIRRQTHKHTVSQPMETWGQHPTENLKYNNKCVLNKGKNNTITGQLSVKLWSKNIFSVRKCTLWHKPQYRLRSGCTPDVPDEALFTHFSQASLNKAQMSFSILLSCLLRLKCPCFEGLKPKLFLYSTPVVVWLENGLDGYRYYLKY